jgi:glycosyltransferase involved in cell wall biosynthesis
MRVAFTLIGGPGWIGGANYLENLLSALWELPDRPVTAVLFVGKDADPEVTERLAPYLAQPPVVSPIWERRAGIRLLRFVCGFLLQRDFLAESAFRKLGIDLVFQHQAWYGCHFRIRTLAWIADFQHRRMPTMFSTARFWWRDCGYRALSMCATQLLVSSQDAKHDCEKYYPRSRGRVSVLPFAVRADLAPGSELDVVRQTYELPNKFFYLPNQLWRHKNHLGVIEALRILSISKAPVVVVASGGANDIRHPDYPDYVISVVREYGLQDCFRYLGLIPYRNILPLMRLSVAVINPSFCEGWSTTVEEAKAVGAPLLLSDLPIHREQSSGLAEFFDPSNPFDIARALQECWERRPAGPRIDAETSAAHVNGSHRTRFARSFVEICESVLS